MITNYRNMKCIECDSCGMRMEADTFDEALQLIKDENWKTVKTEDGYEHYCVDCKQE